MGGGYRYSLTLPNGTNLDLPVSKDDRKTLDEILSDLKLSAGTDKIATDKFKPKNNGDSFDGFFVETPAPNGTSIYVPVNADGSFTPPKDSGGQPIKFPANTTIKPVVSGTGKNIITFTVVDKDGNEKQIPVEVASGTSATWKQIKDAAKDFGVTIGEPSISGYDLKKLEKNGSALGSFDDNTSFAQNDKIALVYEKDITYIVDAGLSADKEAKFTVKYPENGVTVKDILGKVYNENTSDIDAKILANYPTANQNLGAFESGNTFKSTNGEKVDGWKVITPDGKTKIVKINELQTAGKFPAGTRVEPNLVTPPRVTLGSSNESIDFTFFEGGMLDATPIGDFYIANTEITRAQWKAVMLTGTSVSSDSDWVQKNGSNQWTNAHDSKYGDSNNDKLPMNQISWYDAIMFCNQLSKMKGRTPYYVLTYENEEISDVNFFTKLNSVWTIGGHNDSNHTQWANIKISTREDNDKPGFRLPDSNYWRYAAHGGKDRPYPTYSGAPDGTDAWLNIVASYDGNGKKMREVGTMGGSSLVRDMTGNVSEWCWDKYANYSRLYIGGTYDSGKASQVIDAVTNPSTVTGAMFTDLNNGETDPIEKYQAGATGDRGSQGMRIIIPKLPTDIPN